MRTFIPAFLLLLAAVACGHKSSDKLTAEHWQVLLAPAQEEPPAIIVRRGLTFAIGLADGKVVGQAHVVRDADFETFARRGRNLVWSSALVVHATDVADGHEIWHVNVRQPLRFVVVGDRHVAIRFDDGGTEVRSLVDGRVSAADEELTGQIVFESNTFYLARSSGVTALSDETGAVLWNTKIDRMEESALKRDSNWLYVVRRDHSAIGVSLSTGVIEKQGERGPRNQEPLRVRADGAAYFSEWSAELASVFLADPTGGRSWTYTFPSATSLPLDARTSSPTGYVAFPTGDQRVYVVDDRTGQLMSSEHVSSQDRFEGLSSDCALVSSIKALTCFDVKSGEAKWSKPTYGDRSAVIRLEDGDVLLADANPVTVTRLHEGKQVWRTELPAAFITDDGRVVEPVRIGDYAWLWSRTLGYLERDSGLVVMDLRTGTIAELKTAK